MAWGSATFSTECCIVCVVQADNVTAIAATAMGLMVRSLECEETTGSAAASATDSGCHALPSPIRRFSVRLGAGSPSEDCQHAAVAISD